MGESQKMKVALVYDRVNKFGGAERILLALHKIFPNAPLYTSVYNKENASWADRFVVKTSFLQHIPFAKNHHEWFAVLMPFAFSAFSFSEYDVVISVTSESAKGIHTSGKTKHLCYILTPTRYLWSGYNEYFKSFLFKIVGSPFVWGLRKWDLAVSQKPNKYVVISKEVQKRVKKYYNKEASLVYPPVELVNKKSVAVLDKGYFLIVSRLVSYKKIDIAIQACMALNIPLKIIGVGKEHGNLLKISNEQIEFLGTLTDDQVVGYYRNCRALLFPGEEDLGLTVIEAQLFGKPVVAFKGGGALETIIEGKTGEFFYPQTAKALQNVLANFNPENYKEEACKKNADRYSFKIFKEKFVKEVKSIS